MPIHMLGRELNAVTYLVCGDKSFHSLACPQRLKYSGMSLQTTDNGPRVYCHWGLITPQT